VFMLRALARPTPLAYAVRISAQVDAAMHRMFDRT
jgi:hypothetical protein